MTKREFNIDDPLKSTWRRKLIIDQRMVIRCRPVIADYKVTPLPKQFFKLMEWCRDNNVALTKGTVISILRRKMDTNEINKRELWRFGAVIHDFREWLGALAAMVVYTYKDAKTKQWMFRPLSNKSEYMKVAGRHIEKVRGAMQERHNDNLTTLSLPQKEIERRIQEISKEIDIEVGLPPQQNRKRKARK
jgi:hypothetical protein